MKKILFILLIIVGCKSDDKRLNATSYLLLPDSLNQAVHPDIYYNPNGFAGYKYWMAYNPYTNGNVALENAFVAVSNDGQTFTAVPGASNPVFPYQPPSHNSDPDIFEGGDGKLWLINRSNKAPQDSLYIKSTPNGVTWSNSTLIATGEFASLLSPAVIHKNGIYNMWYVDGSVNPRTVKLRTATNPNGIYTAPKANVFINMPTGCQPWHIDILRDGEEYIMLLCVINAESDALHNTKLYLANSADGINWRVNNNPLLSAKPGAWDNGKIYRSTGLFIDQGGQKKLGIYYSAFDSLHAVHVGYTIADIK